jgi:hypothetical protein
MHYVLQRFSSFNVDQYMSNQPNNHEQATVKQFDLIHRKGFALIASISILSLCVMIALALVSLSQTTTKTSVNADYVEQARANARLALASAIAKLQEYSGLDTRITAPANLLLPDAPPLVGVWKSWEGSNHNTGGGWQWNGRPRVPDYSSKTGSRFVGYLVSGSENITSPTDLGVMDLISSTGTNDTVALLAGGSLGVNPGQIHVKPILLDNGSGSLAWWVSPENQKARVLQSYNPRTDDTAGYAEQWQSHSASKLEQFGLSSLDEDKEAFNANGKSPGGKAFSLATTKLMADNLANPQRNFHDLSTSAVGLLTNSATSGWRKDLSILSEQWNTIYGANTDSQGRATSVQDPSIRLPLFRYTPNAGSTSLVQKPIVRTVTAPQSNGSSIFAPPGSAFYPWSSYSQTSAQIWPNSWNAASASWESLISYARLYKKFDYYNGACESPIVWTPDIKFRWQGGVNDATADEYYDFNHNHRINPVLARFQFIVYLRAFEDPARLNYNPKRFQVNVIFSPVLTLWNPYNIRIKTNIPGAPTEGLVVGGRRSFPVLIAREPTAWYASPSLIPKTRYSFLSPGNFQYLDTNGNYNSEYDIYLTENRDLHNPGGTFVPAIQDLRTWAANIPNGELVMEPGEVLTYSGSGLSELKFGGTAMGLKPGYNPQAPAGLPLVWKTNETAGNSYWIAMKNEAFTKPFRSRSAGRGWCVEFGTANGTAYTATHDNGDIYSSCDQPRQILAAITNSTFATNYWPAGDFQPHRLTVGEIASVPMLPIYSITIGPKFTIGTGVGSRHSRPTKGLIQSDPLSGVSTVNPSSLEPNNHPANSNYEVSYNTLTFGSSYTPNLSQKEGFMATGFQSGDGLSRLITHDLPLRPIASLMELQGWNPKGRNPMPPFASHLVGNSDANPMIPANNIVPSVMSPNNLSQNLIHDDAYCANHLLFDDFFFSSIAPNPTDFGRNVSRSIQTVYSDFLRGNSPLTNRSYKLIASERGLSDAQITTRLADILNSQTGFQRIASRLEVEGMFNINSTSVEAWKALLGHARTIGNIPIQHPQNGIIASPSINDRPHPVTRTPIGSDIEAGSDGAIRKSELTGFRRLTDSQIDDLANKIVAEIRKRGPFLSLSEFINRRLSTDVDLALAGAVQTAINNLSSDPMAVIRDPANFLSDDTMAKKANAGSAIDQGRIVGTSYAFPKAAEGSSTYGMPGWIRQADLLRPIAPILSARDDTFTVRAYGDARDTNGNVVARAWCEATVTRQRDFVDASDSPEAINPPVSQLNQRFGRRYNVVSFRWLLPDEV